ncbi:MAG: redoxin domain-containing protein [Candidatus Scalindua sp.]|nr:redoxin domain-containing protein [Candidatus Scalindua sp.]
MKKRGVLASVIIVSFLLFWIEYPNTSISGMRPDADAGLELDTIRSNLGNIAKMKVEDARGYYEKALRDLNALIEEYPGTEEAQEALFYVGATHNEIGNFEKAIECFDTILKQGEITDNFKARLLYFKAKALLEIGEVEEAKEVVTELKVIEPRAANSFGRELSGRVRLGMEAPDINVLDYEGKPVSVSQYRGKVVVLDFWATWSDHCLQEYPKVKNLHRMYKDQGVQFIGISLDDNIEDLKSFVGTQQVEWPQVFEGMRWKGKVSKLFSIEKIPVMFVIDQEGKIRFIGGDKTKVSKVIEQLLSKHEGSPSY